MLTARSRHAGSFITRTTPENFTDGKIMKRIYLRGSDCVSCQDRLTPSLAFPSGVPGRTKSQIVSPEGVPGGPRGRYIIYLLVFFENTFAGSAGLPRAVKAPVPGSFSFLHLDV